ncbi:hypothetical protein [Streptomyces sp. NPDC046976]|uniref:hypothetical protein n=1 Tax=Streptomyces sp. NPDC046976 TaxID=3155258 RepID=UPI0033CA0F15
MSHDAADDTQAEQSTELPLTSLGLIGALARALEDHQKGVIKPKKDAPLAPLINTFLAKKQSNLVVEIGGEEVGRYKVNVTRDRFEIADRTKFDAYAEKKDEIDVILTAKPAFESACLAHAVRNPETGTIFDSRTGEEIPGLEFVPGGEPTGTLTFTWKSFKGEPIGKNVLLAAARRGDLDELLKETPELLPGEHKK